MIKYIYALFLGLLLATFVGTGISTFYPGPEQPDWTETSKPALNQTEEDKAETARLEAEQQTYMDDLSVYNRNVSLLALAGAMIILVISLTVASKLYVIADGLLLGGVFTLLYSIIRGLSSEDVRYRFAITTVGLIAALVIGWVKFLREKKA